MVIDTSDVISVKVRERMRRINGTITLGYEVEVGTKKNGYIGAGIFDTRSQAESYAIKSFKTVSGKD